MHGVARLTFRGGERLMPARNGYDRELVFEEAERSARRHGHVQLEFSSFVATVSAAQEAKDRCCDCEELISRLHFVVRTRSFCRRCVRSHVR